MISILFFLNINCAPNKKPKLLGFFNLVNNTSSTTTSPSISYSGSPFSLTVAVTISSISPTVTGTILSCSSLPTLPIGFSLSSICIISGTPTTITNAADYIITPTFTIGTASTKINISVVAKTYKIFVTGSTYTGDLKTLGAGATGPTGADNLCNSDSSKPTSATYKAIINDATNRNACSITSNCTNPTENVNWILKPNTQYVRASDSATIFTTNTAGVFTNWNMANSFDAGAQKQYWTGFSNGTIWGHSTTDCNAWTNSTNSNNGRVGQSNALSYNDAIRDAVISPTCDLPQYLLCAEQ